MNVVKSESIVSLGSRRRDRVWLNRTLRTFFWRREAAFLIDEMGYGWCDGGCHTCVRGIQQYLLQSKSLYPATVNLAAIADIGTPAQHVVVGLHHLGERLFLDANGIRSENSLLGYWVREEHLKWPWIDEECDPNWLSEEVAFNPRISTHIAALLENTIGSFSLEWITI